MSIMLILFGLFFAAVLVWFYLCRRLFRILEMRHPAEYEAMGKPSLIKNNTPSSNMSFAKFLLRRDWQKLDDNGLALLGRSMLIFLVTYLIGLLAVASAAQLGYLP